MGTGSAGISERRRRVFRRAEAAARLAEASTLLLRDPDGTEPVRVRALPRRSELAAQVRLRAAIRVERASVESLPIVLDLIAGRIDLVRYAALLRALHRMFVAWEESLRDFLWFQAPTLGWDYVSRSCLLAADLDCLGAPRSNVHHAQPTVHDGVLDAAQAWGMLYAVESTSLGGQIIAARVRSALPDCAAFAFFSVGCAASMDWMQFRRILNAALRDDREVTLAIAGARRMTATLHRVVISAG